MVVWDRKEKEKTMYIYRGWIEKRIEFLLPREKTPKICRTYSWKILEDLAPKFGVETFTSHRIGRLCTLPKIPHSPLRKNPVFKQFKFQVPIIFQHPVKEPLISTRCRCEYCREDFICVTWWTHIAAGNKKESSSVQQLFGSEL